MKTLMMLVLLLVSGSSMAQINQGTNLIPEHPRLLFMKGEEAKVHRLIKKDRRMAKLHASALCYADSVLDFPCNERIKEGIRLLPVSRKNINYMVHLAYAYRMTGDVKYAERAKKELVKLSEFSDWNPSHYLDVAEMGLAAAIGYDWLYDYLDADTKQLVEKALMEKIVNPSCGPYVFQMSRENNWNQVCNAGTSIAALAIYEKIPEQTVGILNRAIKNLPIVMKEYAPDGAYIEGYEYWGYGTTYNVILIDLLQKLFGDDFGLKEQPGFMNTAWFHESMVTPALNTYNYGDNLNIPARGVNPTMFWFYKETKNQDLLYNAKLTLSGDTVVRDRETHRFNPLALVWAAEGDVNLSKIKAPKVNLYQGMGENPVVCFRSSWKDRDGAFLGFKGGRDRISHGHQDVGSFVFESNQVKWALELGQESYHQLEEAKLNLWGEDRWKIYRYNCFNHNMITFDGKPVKENKYIALEKSVVKKDGMTCQADLSPLFEGQVEKVVRKVSLNPKKVCVIADEVKCADKDAVLCWRMASQTERMEQVDEQTFVLLKGNKKLRFTVELNGAAPEALKMDLKPAVSEHAYDSANPGINFVEFKLKLKAGSENLVRVVMQ